MKRKYLLKLGPNGEIFLPPEVRELLGPGSGQRILMKVYPQRVILQKFESLEDILNEPVGAKISYHVLKSMEADFN
ncbi:MAG: hypothetical protein EU544_02115 [Promethearchaeota archaeon]|nr:MAG: hypothetical protein EU544_02115 [Candidatus Lokiarchaeota archaeon]